MTGRRAGSLSLSRRWLIDPALLVEIEADAVIHWLARRGGHPSAGPPGTGLLRCQGQVVSSQPGSACRLPLALASPCSPWRAARSGAENAYAASSGEHPASIFGLASGLRGWARS